MLHRLDALAIARGLAEGRGPGRSALVRAFVEEALRREDDHPAPRAA